MKAELARSIAVDRIHVEPLKEPARLRDRVLSDTVSVARSGLSRPSVFLNKRCHHCGYAIKLEDWICVRCKYEPEVIDGFRAFAPDLIVSDSCYAQELIDELAQLEARNFWFKSRNHLITDAVRRYFPQLGSFLEVGCGTGFVLSGLAQAFPSVDLVGCDALITALRYARRRLRTSDLYQMDARSLPFVSSFDVIGCFDVIEHIEEDTQVLSEMYRALKPGGGLIVTVPQQMLFWSKCDDLVKHVRRYEFGELERKVQEAGFKVLITTGFVSLLLPAFIASRVWQKISPFPHDLISELRMQGLGGGVCEWILAIERALISHGFSFPVGGSLLLVAIKPSDG